MQKDEEITLPKPKLTGTISVEEAISGRRSVRAYEKKEVPTAVISQIVWSAQGITDMQHGLRAVPSGGAMYPLELYVINDAGIFLYIPDRHVLQCTLSQNVRNALTEACLGQRFVDDASFAVILCAIYERITRRYGERGRRYADVEVGHAAQNISLQAQACGLSTVMVGAFDERSIVRILRVPDTVIPIYVIPVGYKK